MHSNKMKIAGRFPVHRGYLIAFIMTIAVFTLPGVVSDSYILKRIFLLAACMSLLLGWVFLLKEREGHSAWRRWIALATSLYLTASLPVFLFEMSQIKWLMRHPWHRFFSAWVWPWVRFGYQGYLLVLLGVLGSFFGRGRARTAFLVSSILLLILRASTGTWVY